MVSTTATTRELPYKVVGVGRRDIEAFWSISNTSFFLHCHRLVVVVASAMGGRTEGDVDILEREVASSTTDYEGMCERHRWSDVFRRW